MASVNTPTITFAVNLTIAGFEFEGSVSNRRIAAKWHKGMRETGFCFADIPLIGNIVQDRDGLYIDSISFAYSGRTEFSMDATLRLWGNETMLSIPPRPDTQNKDTLLPVSSYGMSDTTTGISGNTPDIAKASSGGSGDNDIKWVDVNKSISGFNIQKIGFSMGSDGIKIYLSAAISISVLRLELYECYASLPIGGGDFSVGLKGMKVSLNAAPFLANGGLYASKTPEGTDIYNGGLTLKINDLTLSAIGSYATVSGSPSFFLYAFLGYPLGGPAFFFVTGIALGFGINRTIILPELEQVPVFPFVQAINEPKKSSLANSGDASAALASLSDWIRPSLGDYFAVAGVRFTSFAVVESFALLMVEFGSRFRITLLGQSVLTMPIMSNNPILYVKLLFRAFFDADSGYIELRATLSKDSYLLSKSCRLQGGVAVCVWTKGDRAGDFMVSVGGCHHPLFMDKAKYPQVDKVGINWQISNNLSLKGLGYFAVTHSCAMGGVDISIDYKAGNLEAWFRAKADFYVQWKPLFYDVAMSVRIGASYKLDLWICKVTIRIELGAELHLWGPEFAGKVRLDCYVFSIVISFGPQKRPPMPIGWDDFYKSFLPQDLKENCGQLYSGSGSRLSALAVTNGIMCEDGNRLFIRSEDLAFTVTSSVPCTGFSCSVLGTNKPITFETADCGIVPMSRSDFSCQMDVSVKKADGSAVFTSDCLSVSPIHKNLGGAIWGKKHDPNASIIKNVPMGLEFKFDAAAKIEKIYGPYQFSDLQHHNDKSYAWNRTPIQLEIKETSFYDCSPFVIRQRSKDMLKKLAAVFYTGEEAVFRQNFANAPQDYLWEEPKLWLLYS